MLVTKIQKNGPQNDVVTYGIYQHVLAANQPNLDPLILLSSLGLNFGAASIFMFWIKIKFSK